jgi:hypothetical protein
MAKTQASTAVTWASGSSTTSGTSNAVDISASYESEVNVQIVQTGTASVGAQFYVELSADGTNFRSSIGPFNAGLAAATYKFPPIVIGPGQSAVRIVQTAQTGGTSSAITVDVGRVVAI